MRDQTGPFNARSRANKTHGDALQHKWEDVWVSHCPCLAEAVWHFSA